MTLALFSILALGFGIAVAGGLAIYALINLLVTNDNVNERMEAYALIDEESPQRAMERRRARINRFRLRLNNMLSIFVSEELSLQLLSANWPITETEYLLIRFWGAVLGLILGWAIFRSPFSGFGVAVLLYLLPGVYLRMSINRRQQAFEHQLVDVLVLINGAIRAGYSLLQSLDVVVREMKSPANDEFRRVRREVGLGLPISQALLNLTSRMQNDDLYLVVTAININQQVGGNLVTMLEAVTQTIRERIRLFAEVRVLTSQQRFSSYVLTLIPIGVGALMFALNPSYMAGLFTPGVWLCIPAGAVVGIILGNIWIRRLSRIEV
jgi:tight adherence protein B